MAGLSKSLKTTLGMLAGLAVLSYLPVFVQPFVSDDYVQIHLARQYGPISGWPALAADPLYRCRATSLLATWWTEKLFSSQPLPFYSTGVLLHILNTWLVFALGVWRPVGWRVSAVAAAFFAVHEGHQEAVMWYAALPELLVFFWAVGCFACWVLWVHSGGTRRAWYAAALACFGLGLLSKESAVAVIPLLTLPLWTDRVPWRRSARWIAPYIVLSVPYVWQIFAARPVHVHLNDAGTFSFHGPFWIAWSNSFGRLLWIWGIAALVVLLAWRSREWRVLTGLSLAWISITLLPYSFLTYMPHVPSRHTYFASAGLAWIVAAGFLAFRERFQARWATAALASAILAHNVGYLWVKKRGQFLERAAPTEALLEQARTTRGPLYIHCFPYGYQVAEYALEIVLGRPASDLVWEEPASSADVYCVQAHPPNPAARPAPTTLSAAPEPAPEPPAP